VRRLVELQVHNYRSLRDVTVQLGPLTVLVGPNAAGKSNLLDAIRFLGDAARDDLQPALDRRGGYDRVRFRGAAKGGISVGVHALVTRSSARHTPDTYTLELNRRQASSGAATIVREERFGFRRGRDRHRQVTVSGAEVRIADVPAGRKGAAGAGARLGLRRDALGLATLPKLSDAEAGEEVGRIAGCLAGARFVDVDVRAARRPAGGEADGGPLRADASNLTAFLHRLARDDERFASFERDAQAVVPGLIAIEFEEPGRRAGDGGSENGADAGVTVRLREMGLDSTTGLADASHGTVRALALLAALHDPDPPALTCVEAFDHGLHPDAVDVLVERARGASARTQLLLTSHSQRLAESLRPKELLRCARGEDGASRLPAP
jgi:predicted ATPase